MIEIAPEEIPGESLDQHIKAKVPTIDPDARVGDAWRRNASRVEQSATDIFRAEAGILNGIVEMNLLQAVKTLVRDKLAETQRQRRLVINRTKTAGGPFEMNRHIGVNPFAFPHGGWHKFPRFPAQRFQIGFRDFNLETQHGGVRQENVRAAFHP